MGKRDEAAPTLATEAFPAGTEVSCVCAWHPREYQWDGRGPHGFPVEKTGTLILTLYTYQYTHTYTYIYNHIYIYDM